MTIPAVTRFDDFRFALYDLTAGTQAILNPDSIIDPQFETVPGVGSDRLKSITFDIPWYADARAEFDFDHLQLLAIGRYSDPALTLWGVVLKPKEGYSARVARDTIQIQAVQVEELLKCRKVFEYVDAENKPMIFVNAKPDDIAKAMVRRVFTGVDVDGNARDWEWGTLTVEADAAQCVESIGLTVGSGPDPADTLWKRIDDLARTYDFDYQLVPSLSGGAWTFTFKTQAPYGGDDLTTGVNRVTIKDLYNLIPNATRFRDAAFRATRMYISGYRDSVEDADAITAWGLWEGLADGAQLAEAEIALEKARVKAGAEYGFEATGANGMVLWLEDFKAGDTVNRVHNKLGIEADSEKIAAVIGRFVNKVLALTIRWGDREPAVTDRMQGGTYKSDEPGGEFLKDPLPVGNTADPGDDPTHLIYGDHVHPLSITADDDGVMVLTDGTGVLAGGLGISTRLGNDGEIILDSLWQLTEDIVGGDYIHQGVHGRALKLFDGADGLAFHITGDGDVYGNVQAIGSPFRIIALTDYDMVAADHDTSQAGLHDLTVSGNIISQIDTTASRFEWLGGSDGEDAVKIRNWSVYSNTAGTTLRAQYNITNGLRLLDADGSTPVFTVAPTSGNSVWKAGATWTIEGDVYTLPTAYPVVSGYHLASTDAGVLSWAAPAIGAIGVGTAQYQVPMTGASPFTPAWHTTTVTSAANSIPRTDASGYLRATRLEVGGATYYIDKASANIMRIMAANSLDLGAGSEQVRLQDGVLFPLTTNDVAAGTTTYRWSNVATVLADISGDVTLAAGSDLTWGGDTNLYRSAANMLKTDDGLTVSLDVQLADGSDILWGSDVKLYRASASLLKTDDTFSCYNLQITGQSPQALGATAANYYFTVTVGGETCRVYCRID